MTPAHPVVRRRHSRSAFVTVILFAFVAVASQPVVAQYLHPKVTGKQTMIRRVVILPAKVDVVRDSMKGPEGMAAESDALSTRVEDMVSEVLTKKKDITRLSDMPTGTGDSQAKYTVADTQAKFDELLPKIMKKRSDVKKGRFTMGDEILNLNADKSSDAIVFIRGRGQKLTSGKKAFTLLVGGTPAFLTMQIAIVDAHTGEVLLYTDTALLGDPTTAVDRLRKALEKGFKKLPSAESRP
jgi:hypothetical protein